MDLPKLIALDLDGTLLPESKRISERSRDVLGRLEEAGTRITLATGKFLHLARDYGDQLGLETLVALDGARILSHDRGISEHGFSRATARTVLRDYIDPDWDVFADNGADELLLRSNKPELDRITRLWARRVRRVDDLAAEMIADPGILVFFGPHDELERLGVELGERFSELRPMLYYSELLGSARITLQPRGTTKGSGVRSLLDHFGIQPHECMVFGDWHNDLAMFEVGCVNVAMANAVPELKAFAHYVTERTSEADGVADFLERAFL